MSWKTKIFLKNSLIFSILFPSIFSINSYGNTSSSWQWVHPYPQGNSLRKVEFVNSNTGYLIGDFGTILKTTNGGVNWNVMFVGKKTYLNGISFINASTGIICGQSSIFKTTTGGLNWITLLDTSFTTFRTIKMIDENNIFLLGRNNLFYSKNGGLTWSPKNINTGLNDMFFFNKDTGYIVGSDLVVRTKDGGESFQYFNFRSGNNYLSVNFKDYNTGIITFVGPNSNYTGSVKTTNSGISWTCPNCGWFQTVPYYAKFNGNYGIGTEAGILFSTNFGESWNNANSTNSSYLSGLGFADANNCFGVGDNGRILKSTNRGMDWENLNRYSVFADLRDVIVFSNNVILVFGRSGYNGIIYRTTDSGQNWNVAYTDTVQNSGIYKAKFINDNTGFAVGQGGEIVKTTTSGQNWFNIDFSTTPYRAITSLSNDDIIIAGINGTIIISNDLGLSWKYANSSTTNNLFGIEFINDNTGFSVGSYGTILKSTDSGENWFGINSPTNNHLYDINFFDDSIGIAVGFSGTILRTTNSGMNWMIVNGGVSDYLLGVKAVNENIYIVGRGLILKSINKGESWTMEDVVYGGDLLGLNFRDSSSVYAVGQGGTIMREFKTIPINIISNNSIVNSYSISQNYPNPFNPITKINYELPITNNVSIKVYDVLGKQVKTLVNEKQNAGSYSVDFNGVNLPSGVYFYRLESGEFSDIKRMILVK